MSKVIYAFSGDPITFGHMDIIERASKVFDEVIACIGINPNKKCLFSVEERVAMARDAVKHLHNVSVTSFNGLTVDFAYENDIHVIIRGLRNAEDFNFELMLHQLCATQIHGIETFLIPCRQHLAHISSSAVKALQLEQGSIHEFVPLNVKQKLEGRISGQLIIGVTGEVGSGKSYLVKQLLEIAGQREIKAHAIDLDKLAHEILERSAEPIYQSFRKNLVEKFGRDITSSNGFIDRQKLGEKIFPNTELIQQFNEMIYQPLFMRLRKEIYHKRGLILLESALLAETNSMFYCNNHVIVTNCTKDEQTERLNARGYSAQKAKRLLGAQYSYAKKVSVIENQIAKDGFGKLLIAANEAKNTNRIFDNICQRLPAISVA